MDHFQGHQLGYEKAHQFPINKCKSKIRLTNIEQYKCQLYQCTMLHGQSTTTSRKTILKTATHRQTEWNHSDTEPSSLVDKHS